MPDLLKLLVLAVLVAARFTINLCDGSPSFDQRVYEEDVEGPETTRDASDASLKPRMNQFLAELYLEELRRKHEDNSAMLEYHEDGVDRATEQEEFAEAAAAGGGEDEKRFSEFLGGKRKRFSEFLGGKKRFSEFLGGKRKRFSEFLGGKRKRFSEFLGGKKRSMSAL